MFLVLSPAHCSMLTPYDWHCYFEKNRKLCIRGRELFKKKQDKTPINHHPPQQTKIQTKKPPPNNQSKLTKSPKPPKAKGIPTQKCIGEWEESACSESCQDKCSCIYLYLYDCLLRAVAVFNFSFVVWFVFFSPSLVGTNIL